MYYEELYSPRCSTHFAKWQNPLSFDLPAKYEGDLQTAVEQLSADILSSCEFRRLAFVRACANAGIAHTICAASPNMPTIVDLRTQLADRLMRLSTLINFINSNGLLGKVGWNALDLKRRQVLNASATRFYAFHTALTKLPAPSVLRCRIAGGCERPLELPKYLCQVSAMMRASMARTPFLTIACCVSQGKPR